MFRKFARMQSNLNIQRNLNSEENILNKIGKIPCKSVSLGDCKTAKVKEELYIAKKEKLLSLAATEQR
jgi:hypothetical protein